MAKTKTKTKAKTAPPAAVTVRYDLRDLPTAQHKAGLAGLMLQVESMRERKVPAALVPDIKPDGPAALVATFTPESLVGLFDDLYAAKPVRVESPTKWANAELLGTLEKPDKTGKPKTFFAYNVVQPDGRFLRRYADGDNEIWHKLWRNMLWDVPRGKPLTRGPYNAVAAGKTSGEGEAAWEELLKMRKAAERGETATCEIGSALLLGAQAVNAESVPFRDRVEHALLLHFWPLTTRIFVPERFDASGERDFVGYVLAVPEVADLPGFARAYTHWLGTLDPKPNGYRPAAAVVSLPAEGALEFMNGLARVVAGEAGEPDYNPVAGALVGVEFFHVDKRGNNVKALTQGRLAADRRLLREYNDLRQSTRNPFFRQGRLLALLRGRRWYAAFDDMLAENAADLFVRTEKTPRLMPSFAADVRRQFATHVAETQRRKESAMSNGSPSEPADLETIVFRLVQNYVRRKTEEKSGWTYESFRNNKSPDANGQPRISYPKEYTDAQERVCQDLFLSMRSRNDEDFVSYFTGAVSSVAQKRAMPDDANFAVIARALLGREKETWRDVKTLAMLAVSAASYSTTGRDDAAEPKETK